MHFFFFLIKLPLNENDICLLVTSFQAKGQDIVQRSVLGPVLPEAMVCYLENYEAERFSEIFLGEFDTPEAIWSSEMRYKQIC